MKRIEGLVRHYEDGSVIPDSLSLGEKSELLRPKKPSPMVAVRWEVDGLEQTLVVHTDCNGKPLRSISLLPDSSGLLAIDAKPYPQNASLLDEYGVERVRLLVPWGLTGQQIPLGAEMWFRAVSEPYANPLSGLRGAFGVTAWIEYAGDYYFELDWRIGSFQWGRAVRL